MKTVSLFTVVVLLATTWAGAAGPDTRIEGLVMDLDGRPADGYRVHLIDETGQDAAQSAIDETGTYRFQGLETGRYALALETPDGRFAAVEAAPVRVREGHLQRRDLKLVERDPAQPRDLTQPAYGWGEWWAGLSGGAKAWTIVAMVAVVGITASALSSDETPASTFDVP